MRNREEEALEKKMYILGGCCIVVIVTIAQLATMYVNSYKAKMNEQNKAKITQLKQDGYSVYIDGIEIESIDEEFDTTRFIILYDSDGKNVVLTAK